MPFERTRPPPSTTRRRRPIPQATIGLLILILWLVYIILTIIN